MRVDLRQAEEVAGMMAAIDERFGGLEILINNIERGGMPVVHGPYVPDQWDLEMATTLKAKWWAVHHAMPLLKQGGEGVIITLSSIAGIIGRNGPAGLIFNDGYAAANRAVSSFTETWAREGAPEVRVNELMLGLFKTRHAEETRGWSILTEEQKNALIKRIPLRRTGCMDDIVRTVLFLVRDADYMTGSVIRLDGGYVIGAEEVPAMPAGVL
jgi:3-oxoacyl-[acyl-carrier protein] reductase